MTIHSEQDLPKAYDPGAHEDALYASWEASGAFNPDLLPDRNRKGEPFCIMMPPPNRTGTLHMGHAQRMSTQDLVIRFERMRGKKTLWVPGTDHAAIATQSKVEKLLMQEGYANPREDLGREAFLDRVVQFAAESRDTIVNQAKKMGSSCDWSRERYTFDEERNRAVNTLFQMMFEDGLIERGDRIVNWDPVMQTTVSDDEIEWKEEVVPFYTFQYGPFQIGTVRPETKFGDKYVVMHPEDERYRQFSHGDTFECEWINGPVKATIIKDESIDPSFGTGVMTITPWHTQVDFDIAERHGLDREQVIGYDGKLLPIAGEFAGMSIDDARPKIVEKLRKKGLVVKTDEGYIHNTAVSYRGGGKIEPQVKRQWFVRVNKPFSVRQDTMGGWKKGESATLKELMMHAVRSGQTRVIPSRFEDVYVQWITNLRDWCISRQIWFGHRIPVWYSEEQMRCQVESPGPNWEQDPDTLDTWFSSGAWTFSALGWPDEVAWQAHRMYHPTSLLETGRDLIFFWIARMILMSTYALGEVPFRDVYLSGLVTDEQGRKMSKSLGNILDPLELIPAYGTDAVRLSVLLGMTPGQDGKLSVAKVEGFRNFTNKLWNIARFIIQQAQGGGVDARPTSLESMDLTDADRWILARLDQVISSVTTKLESYQFSSAGEELRDFTWGDLADAYLEIAKVEGEKQAILRTVLEAVLKLWHPFMPFVTEHIWSLGSLGDGMLMTAVWPESKGHPPEWREGFEQLREMERVMRRLRAEQGIEPSRRLRYGLVMSDARLQDRFNANTSWLSRRVFASEIARMDEIPSGWAVESLGFATIGLEPPESLDPEKERVKYQKELEEVSAYLSSLKSRLANEEFLAKAPAHVVDGMRKHAEDARSKIQLLSQRLSE